MKRYAMANKTPNTIASREPLYLMEEICEKLGVTRFWVSAMAKTYGAIKPEFSRGNSAHGKPYFKLSVARQWFESIPADVRAKPPRSAQKTAGAKTGHEPCPSCLHAPGEARDNPFRSCSTCGYRLP